MDKLMKYPKQAFSTFRKLPMIQQIVIAAVVVVAAYWLWKKFLVERFDGAKKDGSLRCTMYYTDACHYCQETKPEWEKFIQLFNGKKVNGYSVLVTKIDCAKYPEVAKSKGITGFPTIKFDLNGRETDFSGERKIDGFQEYMEKITKD